MRYNAAALLTDERTMIEPEIVTDEHAMTEPEITINGVRLTYAQAMTVRVAVSSFDANCGYDKPGFAMAKAYTERRI